MSVNIFLLKLCILREYSNVKHEMIYASMVELKWLFIRWPYIKNI